MYSSWVFSSVLSTLSDCSWLQRRHLLLLLMHGPLKNVLVCLLCRSWCQSTRSAILMQLQPSFGWLPLQNSFPSANAFIQLRSTLLTRRTTQRDDPFLAELHRCSAVLLLCKSTLCIMCQHVALFTTLYCAGNPPLLIPSHF